MMIVAGEASADLHGAEVVAELNKRDPGLKIFGVGGQAMRAHAFEALVPAEQMSLAGLTEVLMGLPHVPNHGATDPCRRRTPTRCGDAD